MAAHRASVEGSHVRLPQHSAEALGLAIHELAVNAVKFGALSSAGAGLAVSWTRDQEGLRLEWHEMGVTAVDPKPQRRGFGREWIEHGLPYQLGAQTSLEFLPGGVVCTIFIPAGHIMDGHT